VVLVTEFKQSRKAAKFGNTQTPSPVPIVPGTSMFQLENGSNATSQQMLLRSSRKEEVSFPQNSKVNSNHKQDDLKQSPKLTEGWDAGSSVSILSLKTVYVKFVFLTFKLFWQK
jgi:hypothetical protein